MSTVCQEDGAFHVPKNFVFIFPVKRLLRGCSELIFIFSLQNLYLYNCFLRYSQTSHQRNSTFSLAQFPTNQKLLYITFSSTQASKVVIKTTYDIKIIQILLFNTVEFTHLKFHEFPCCFTTKLLK